MWRGVALAWCVVVAKKCVVGEEEEEEERGLFQGSRLPEEAMYAWIEAEGGLVHRGQVLEEVAGVRGMYAAEDLKDGTVLARIPRSTTIGVGTMCDSAKEAVEELKLGVDGRKWPYLRILEDYDAGLPQYWQDEALETLRRLPPYDFTRHLSWYKETCRRNLDDPLEKRALEFIVARTVGWPGNVEGVMVPVYDLYNHNGDLNQVNTRIVVGPGDDESVAVYAKGPIFKGQQLYTHYGKHTTFLFRDYGFLEPYPRTWHVARLIWREELLGGGGDGGACRAEADVDTTDDTPVAPGIRVVWQSNVPESKHHFRYVTAHVAYELDNNPVPADGPDPVLNSQLAMARAYRDALSSALQNALASIPHDGPLPPPRNGPTS